ncbi:Lanosterol 14-alpha-demethylase [Nowakowskiella sp. JEL0407]|nr:Lanosterol 14-alpha-demethylase [Nowakowskiella sp. JEL0407]
MFEETIGAISKLTNLDQTTVTILLSVLTFVLFVSLFSGSDGSKDLLPGTKLPPVVPGYPFIGSAIEYGVHPVKFLQKCQKQYGDVFTFIMFGQRMTVCLNPDGNHFVFNIPISSASAEDIYQKLTTPVFGEGVVYDCPNHVFMEQKKFIKDSLTTAAFKSYVPIIVKEFEDFFQRYDKEGERVLFSDTAELTIMTASACLQGPEIRSKMDSEVAKLYHYLDQGLTPMNLIFKWLPTPTYIKRDYAHKRVVAIFKSIQAKRIANNEEHLDVLQGLMKAEYRNGNKLSDGEISHMMIALLMAGQHTSSTTMAWTLYRLAANKQFIAPLLEEQSMILTGKPDTPLDELPELDYESVRKMTLMENAIKEALRLNPPIHTVMRKMTKTVQYKEFTIPKGHNICGCASVSQLEESRFPNPEQYDPYRHINSTEGVAEWTLNGVDIAEKSAKSHLLPFGAGRHRCIGENFAYVQLKTLLCMFLRKYDIDLPKDSKGNVLFPKADYTSLITMPVGGSKVYYRERKPGTTAQSVAAENKK